MNRIYLDTEFYEHADGIDLISLGAVKDDGSEFYAESQSFTWAGVPEDHWVKENVRPHLWVPPTAPRASRFWDPGAPAGGFLSWSDIATVFRSWVGAKPQFWAYYADYDWVVLCRLYGRMVDLPDGWPMFCLDIKQLAWSLGDPKLPEQDSTEHHALEDARWNREAYRFLIDRFLADSNAVVHEVDGR